MVLSRTDDGESAGRHWGINTVYDPREFSVVVDGKICRIDIHFARMRVNLECVFDTSDVYAVGHHSILHNRICNLFDKFIGLHFPISLPCKVQKDILPLKDNGVKQKLTPNR